MSYWKNHTRSPPTENGDHLNRMAPACRPDSRMLRQLWPGHMGHWPASKWVSLDQHSWIELCDSGCVCATLAGVSKQRLIASAGHDWSRLGSPLGISPHSHSPPGSGLSRWNPVQFSRFFRPNSLCFALILYTRGTALSCTNPEEHLIKNRIFDPESRFKSHWNHVCILNNYKQYLSSYCWPPCF